ncbi:MAG: hypothetical protein ACI4Q7_04955 [Candidatus Avelusimicrobium sp.]
MDDKRSIGVSVYEILNVPAQILDYVKKVQAERRALPWSELQTGANPLQLVPLQPFGLRAP